MTLTLELRAETQAQLNAEANRRGIAVALLVQELIEAGMPMRQHRVTDEEFKALSDQLAAMNAHIRALRPECYDRAYFYEDSL